MGQIKNIKLHIVTDIKTYYTQVSTQQPSECVTLQLTFSQPSVATTISQQMTSKPSSKVSVSDMTKNEQRSSSTNVKVNPLLNSSKQAPQRWLPCLPVVVAVVELLQQQRVTLLHRKQLKRRRKRRRRNQNLDPMMIWDSDFLIKCAGSHCLS